MTQHVFTSPTPHRTGRRAIAPHLLAQWEQSASAPQPVFTTTSVSLAFKAAAPFLGVGGTAYILMDKMIGMAKGTFERGETPIITRNNAELAAEMNIDIRTVQLALARLIGLGVIIPKDSENLKRGVRRGERYGFDLSPLAHRRDEFVELVARDKAERKSMGQLKAGITIGRRQCLGMIDTIADREVAAALIERVESLFARTPDAHNPASLADIFIGFSTLKTELIRQFSSPLGAKNFTHQKNTDSEPVSYETTEAGLYDAAPDDREPGRESHEPGKSEQGKAPRNIGVPRSLIVTPERLAELVPGLCCYATGDRLEWRDIDEAGEALATHIGLRQTAWARACGTIGRQAALAILIVVLAKQERGQTWNAAGLFVRLAQISERGHLRLEGTFRGLVSGPNSRNLPMNVPKSLH